MLSVFTLRKSTMRIRRSTSSTTGSGYRLDLFFISVVSCVELSLTRPLCVQESIPFAVVGTDKEHQVNGNKVLGRKTKWGIIEGEASIDQQWNFWTPHKVS